MRRQYSGPFMNTKTPRKLIRALLNEDSMTRKRTPEVEEEVFHHRVVLKYERLHEGLSLSEKCLIALNIILFIAILLTGAGSVVLYLVVNSPVPYPYS